MTLTLYTARFNKTLIANKFQCTAILIWNYWLDILIVVSNSLTIFKLELLTRSKVITLHELHPFV